MRLRNSKTPNAFNTAMNAAKNGDVEKVEETLEYIGPHLGKNIDLLFHIGVLLKKN